MSFSEKDYSLLAVSICKSREERMREEKSDNKFGGSSGTATLAKKVVKKMKSMLRSRSRYSRRKSTMVFNYSAYANNSHHDHMNGIHDPGEADHKFVEEEPQRLCPDLSASSRRHF